MTRTRSRGRGAPGGTVDPSAAHGDWLEAGFDDGFIRHCMIAGWSLADVEEVLCLDTTNECPMDWCFTGLNPIEVRAAIRDLATCPKTPHAPRQDVSEAAERMEPCRVAPRAGVHGGAPT